MSKMYTKCDDYLKNQVLDWFQSPKDDKFLGLTSYLLPLHSYLVQNYLRDFWEVRSNM